MCLTYCKGSWEISKDGDLSANSTLRNRHTVLSYMKHESVSGLKSYDMNCIIYVSDSFINKPQGYFEIYEVESFLSFSILFHSQNQKMELSVHRGHSKSSAT